MEVIKLQVNSVQDDCPTSENSQVYHPVLKKNKRNTEFGSFKTTRLPLTAGGTVVTVVSWCCGCCDHQMT